MDNRPITPPHLRTKERGWCRGSAKPLPPINSPDLGKLDKKGVK